MQCASARSRHDQMARRSNKISPAGSPPAVSEGFTSREERESGEGCSRESIRDVDDQALLTAESEGRASQATPGGMHEKPESQVGKRFVRYRNSWIEEEKITLNLSSLREAHRVSQIEEVDESGMSPCCRVADAASRFSFHLQFVSIET